ncbi:hypothetical protein SAMN04488078_106810 [Antarctobacter heliothermus]|uniref:Uncharacterized protein n=1 Tax=Antarctobacter heliothermus TaxID=74033 RepID=A0A239KPT9_9RHOB|nr:hypothetical protein SAMN04488078_106810 [Antarctobacter heliothermus]
MPSLVFGFARVNDLGDQGEAENNKQGSGDSEHVRGPSVGVMQVGYRAMRAKI